MKTQGLYQTQFRSVDGNPVIYLFKRNVDGSKTVEKVTNFTPYFYIEEGSEHLLANESCYVTKDKYTTAFDKSCLKVTCKSPYDMYRIKKSIDYNLLYEADIMLDLRYMIDVVESNEPTNYKVLTFDIETDCSQGFPKKEHPVEPIICVTIHDNYSTDYHTFVWRDDLSNITTTNGNHTIHFFSEEKTMLRILLNYWNSLDTDIVTAWNLGFDIGYLIARLQYLGMKIDKLTTVTDNIYKGIVNVLPKGDLEIVGLVLFDALKGYKKMHFGELSSYSLNSIAADELGEQKEGVHNTGQVWREDINALISYNRKDVELVVKIIAKTKLLSIFEDIKNFAGVREINDCFSASRIHETKILKKYHNKLTFPTKAPFKEYDDENEEEGIKGATVLRPDPRLYKYVFVGDFKSLYPSAIKTFNLSKEKIRDVPSEYTVTVGGIHYDTRTMGVMPSMITELMQLKDEMKKKVEGTGQSVNDKMFAIKTFINSFYGVNLLRSFRLFDIRVGATITEIGRYFHKKCVEYIEQNCPDCKVGYGDTDSIFVEVIGCTSDEYAIKRGREVIAELNANVQKVLKEDFKIVDNNMKIEFEKVFRTVMLFKKKRYAGHIIYEDGEVVDKIKIAGFAARRSDTSRISKVMQKEIFTRILTGKDKNDIVKYITNLADDITQRRIPLEDVAIPVKFNTDPSEYSIQNTPKIRAAIHKQKTTGFGIGAGQKVLMLYVKHPKTSVIVFEDVSEADGYEVDYLTLLEKDIYQKIKSIFETVGWNKELLQVENYCNNLGNKQSTLLSTWM